MCGELPELFIYKVEKHARQANNEEESKGDRKGFFGGMLGNTKVVGEKYFARWALSSSYKKKIAFNYDSTQLVCNTMDGY